MKPVSDLSDPQRRALLVIDSRNMLYKRKRGWSNQSAIIQPITIEALLKIGLVRIRDVKRNGFVFPVVSLTDLGEVYVDRLKPRPTERRVA